MAHDIFISHSSEDKNIADAICAALERENIRCWIAPRDIRPGQDWPTAIVNAIKNSKIMVLVFSENSSRSTQVKKELSVAVNSESIIIPFRIDKTPFEGPMELFLSDTHWLDAMNPPAEKEIESLVGTVRSFLGIKEEIKQAVDPHEEVKVVVVVDPPYEAQTEPEAGPDSGPTVVEKPRTRKRATKPGPASDFIQFIKDRKYLNKQNAIILSSLLVFIIALFVVNNVLGGEWKDLFGKSPAETVQSSKTEMSTESETVEPESGDEQGGADSDSECASLSFSVIPPEGGILEVSPAPNCGDGFTPDTAVTIAQTEDSGYVFTGWEGACEGSGSCSFVVDSELSVTANFAHCFSLTLDHDGLGSDPSASPSSYNCPAGQYIPGESVTLSGANPNSGYAISGWSGTDQDTSYLASNTLTMPEGDHSASVAYGQACFTLARTCTGEGSNPSASPASSSGCPAGKYHAGATINVSADPDIGYEMGSWNGSTNNPSTSTSNTVTMPANNHTVTVNYACLPYLLTVNVNGGRYGTVNQSPSPNCGTGYIYNQVVTLTADPDDEFTYFDDWTDDLTGSINPAQITLDTDKSVTADFDIHYADDVTNLTHSFLGCTFPFIYAKISFTWSDAMYENQYEIWMRNKEDGNERTVWLNQNSTSITVNDFFRCSSTEGWLVVTSVNPYDEASETETIPISSYCP